MFTTPAGAANLLTNPGFDTDTAWLKTGWSIASGVATSGNAGFARIEQTLAISAGQTFDAYLRLGAIRNNAGFGYIRIYERNGTNDGAQRQVFFQLSTASPNGVTPTLTFTPAADCTSLEYRVFQTDGASDFDVDEAFLVAV